MKENFDHLSQKPKEELAAFEEKYIDIIENINSAVYKTNENGIITFISRSVQNVFGYQPHDVLGKNILEFVYEDDFSKAKSTFAKLAIAKNGHEEIRLKSKEGVIKLVKVIHAAVFENSKFTGEMGIVVDIYDSMRKEHSLGFQSDLIRGICEAVISVDKDKIFDGGSTNKSNQELIENALKEVELGLREIFEKSTIIFYTHTPDNIINFINTRSKKFLGFDPAELKMRWTELITDNPLNQKAIELTRLAIETGIPQDPFEIEMKNINNEVRWFEAHQIPVVKDRKTVLIVGSLTEITARKKVEEELLVNQSLLVDALEMACMGHWEYDVTTDNFTFTDQFYKLLQISIEEIGSYSMSSTECIKRFIHPEDIEFAFSELHKAVNSTDPNYHNNHEIRMINADGEVRTMAFMFKFVKNGKSKSKRVYGVSQDITERKMAEIALKEREEKLEESEKFLENIIENIPNMIFVKDAKDLKFAKMNKAGEELLGFSREELIGKTDYELFPKDQADFFVEKDRKVISTRSYLEIPEEKINTRHHGERILHTKKITIRDEECNPKYLLGISEDITQRKRDEQELIEAKEKAEEMNRLKSNFLANMSHELRTPMVGVLGLAEILLDDLNEPSHKEMVAVIMRSGKRLLSTLNSILDISRIEANKQDMNITHVNVKYILEEIIYLYKPLINEKKLHIDYIFPENEVFINSDMDLLKNIFKNLIDNAVKYTNEGGIILKLIVQDDEPDKKIKVEIIDTGIGIPKEFHKIIFDPFRQVSEGYTRNFEGNGLGLSITKKLIELLNGSITLKSELGLGSTFTITFPFTNNVSNTYPEGEDTTTKSEKSSNTLNKINILLVEDDFINALVVNSFLKDNAELVHVSDGKTAIEHCKSKKFDAVLMDISLRGMDGVETFRKIRNIDNHYSRIPIIAVTAHSMAGDKEKFLSFGFTNYLSKPFQRSQLIMLLEGIFKNDQRDNH